MPKVRLFNESNSRERSFTAEQAKVLLSELPEHQREMALEWGQVDIARRHAWVNAQNSKNRHPISVPLNDTAIGVLLRQQGKHAERVFTFHGNPINSVNTKLGMLLGNGQVSRISVGMICGIPGRLGSGKLEHQLTSSKGSAVGELGPWWSDMPI